LSEFEQFHFEKLSSLEKSLVESDSSGGVFPADGEGPYSIMVEGNHDDMSQSARRHFKEIMARFSGVLVSPQSPSTLLLSHSLSIKFQSGH
jgi:hypothetical protein